MIDLADATEIPTVAVKENPPVPTEVENVIISELAKGQRVYAFIVLHDAYAGWTNRRWVSISSWKRGIHPKWGGDAIGLFGYEHITKEIEAVPEKDKGEDGKLIYATNICQIELIKSIKLAKCHQKYGWLECISPEQYPTWTGRENEK